MKVAYIVSRYPVVSHTFILREVQALRREGVEVHTISIRRADPAHLLTEADRAEAATTRNILPPRVGGLIADHLAALFTRPGRYLSTLARAWELRRAGVRGAVWALFYFIEAVLVWRECRRQGVRHLHAHFANVASDVALLAAHLGTDKRAKWTWSFTMHGPTEFYAVADHRLAEKSRAAAFVLCISDFCRSQLMALVPATMWGKFKILHCAVDTAAFAPVEKPTRGDAHVLCVGRLVPVKGQAVLLQAAADLAARGRLVRVTFVGDGPDRPALEARARELGLVDRVTFAGNVGQEKIRDYYASADVFCLPSFAEGVPVVLMEAMAMGLPVVSTRVMGIPELIDHGHGGLLVAPGRADQLALALEHLIETPALRARLAAAGREKVLAEFDLRRVGPQVAAIFREHLAGRGRVASSVPARERGREAPAETAAEERPATTGVRP